MNYMRGMFVHRILLTLLGVCFSALPLGSAQQSPPEVALGQQAEQAGRLHEALTDYVAALQAATEGSDVERQLREKIISLALKLSPRPTLPPDAIRFAGRAKAAVEAAQDPTAFLDAVKEYHAASRLAPWYAPYYFNLGVVLEKGGRPEEATHNYKLYLLAAPDAPDGVAVQEKIGELEYQIEKADQARKKAEEEEAARGRAVEERRHAEESRKQELPRLLAGYWRSPDTTKRYQITVNGTRFEGYVLGWCFSGDCSRWVSANRREFYGTIEGGSIRGFWIKHDSDDAVQNSHTKCHYPPGEYPMQGELNATEDSVTFSAKAPATNPDCSPMTPGDHLDREQ